MELNTQRNSACHMPSMDGMRVAVYLLYLMHVLYIWAVALCCACFAAADSSPNAACVICSGCLDTCGINFPSP